MKLDRRDLAILDALQKAGRQPMVELAATVGLSPTACLRRVQRLEKDGAIRGYRAVLDRAALGLKVEAYVQVNIERQSRDLTERFEQAVQAMPEVHACHVMTGDLDFLLHVFTPDLDAFADFAMRKLIAVPGVRDVRSSLVLQSLKRGDGPDLTLLRSAS